MPHKHRHKHHKHAHPAVPDQRTADDRFTRLAIQLLRRAKDKTPEPAGAVLLGPDGRTILASAHSAEFPGMHAEEAVIEKLRASGSLQDAAGGTLYLTSEPCTLRLSGATPCIELLLPLHLSRIVIAAPELDHVCAGVAVLEAAGIAVDSFHGYEDDLKELGAQNWHLVAEDDCSDGEHCADPADNERERQNSVSSALGIPFNLPFGLRRPSNASSTRSLSSSRRLSEGSIIDGQRRPSMDARESERPDSESEPRPGLSFFGLRRSSK